MDTVTIDPARTICAFSRRSVGGFEHLPLSNFYPSPIAAPRGRVAPTVEHYYQAAKTRNVDIQNNILAMDTPGAAKQRGRRVKLRDDWEQAKLSVMRRALKKKFADPDSPLSLWLMDTAPFELVEGNTWGDEFWGMSFVEETGQWRGENWLGVLLMTRRSELCGLASVESPLAPSFEALIRSAQSLIPPPVPTLEGQLL